MWSQNCTCAGCQFVMVLFAMQKHNVEWHFSTLIGPRFIANAHNFCFTNVKALLHGTASQKKKKKKRKTGKIRPAHTTRRDTAGMAETFLSVSTSPPSTPLLRFAPWRPSLNLMPVLYTILGKYRPAELICFPHQ